jgi:putative aldouronate transport system permease protein
MVQSNKGFRIFSNICLIGISLFCIIPFLLLIVSSVTSESSLIKNGYSFLTNDFDLTAYHYIFTNSNEVARGYFISAVVTIIGTALSLTITTMYAYPLSRKDLPGRNLFSFFLFFTMLFSGGLIPSYIMWTQVFHVKNTIYALIFPNLLMNAFNVIMMRTYFTTNIPEAVTEAARIDGAGELRILARIVLPMSVPIVTTLTLFIGLGYWNDWLNGLYFINDKRLFSLQVLLNKMLMDTLFMMSGLSNNLQVDMGRDFPTTAMKMAISFMGLLPILVIYPFFQRFFVKGIVVGAVKG